MKKKYYITTPIYYPSGKLHIGHAYTTIAADVMARYKKQQGYDVFYLTGSDEHGQKIETVAKKENKEPKVYVDEIVLDMKKLWESLNIDYDRFIRTTDDDHMKNVQKIFSKLLEQGDIYLDKYSGLYCQSDEAYYTKTQAENGVCPDCGKKLEVVEEESYFFRCSKYTDRLLKHFEENPDFLQPAHRTKELINNFIKPGLEDLAVSRTSFKWGVPVLENPNHVIYVWIDALSNYITALGYNTEENNMDKFWPANTQLVGKEIIRFHAIYWPMILMALDIELPKQIFAHGWLLMENDKMSKSKGNVIYPDFLIDNYGEDTLRYYLMREVPFGLDGQFTPTSYINRINNDIVNDLSNLINRTIAMTNKYFSGKTSNTNFSNNNYINHFDLIKNEEEKYHENLEKLNFSKALESLWKIVSTTNKLIDLEEPWILAKDILENSEQLNMCLWTLIDTCRLISKLIEPFMPKTSLQINQNLNLKSYESENKYEVVKEPIIIYQRLDKENEITKIREKMKSDAQKAKEKLDIVPRGTIKLEDFTKVNIEVGQIKKCIKHSKADKLYVLDVETKDGQKQIVSGLVQYYKEEELLERKVLLGVNLEEVKIMGILSQGMILTTESDEKVSIIDVDNEVGAVVK